MSRYPEYETPEGIARRWAENRGQGEHASFKPWFRRFDFPSCGERRESFFRVCDRPIHTFSHLEFRKALLGKTQDGVTDMWEQYPMPLEETLDIAASIPVVHPRSPRTGEYVVMTNDLLLIFDSVVGRRRVAWDCKYQDDLRFWRTLEKLEISRLWHKHHGNAPLIATDEISDENYLSNLEWLHALERRDAMLGYPSDLAQRVDTIMRPMVDRREQLLWQLAARADDALGFKLPVCLYACRYLLSAGIWKTDLRIWVRATEPLVLLS